LGLQLTQVCKDCVDPIGSAFGTPHELMRRIEDGAPDGHAATAVSVRHRTPVDMARHTIRRKLAAGALAQRA
jgi:hypothetical protein